MTARATLRPARSSTRHEPPNTLLEDPNIRDWYESRKLRSALSADVYLRQIRTTLMRLRLSPDEATALAKKDPDKLRRLLIGYAATLKEEGRLDSYVAKTFDGLRSYFRFQRVPFDGFPKLSPIRGASLSKERVPSPEELGRVLERLSLRGRLIILMMAHTGVRPGVLGSYRGKGGLTLGDLPDLNAKKLQFSEVPFAVRVPASLSKTRVTYTTFGTQQLATVFLTSLRERREGGEKIGPGSPLVAPAEVRGAAKESRDKSRGGPFLTTKAIVGEVREALHAEAPKGVTFRPYVARSYCSTRLLLAEGAGRISRDLREAILGHDTGVAGRYTVGKRWGEELLAEARREYSNASEFLETNASMKTDIKRELVESLVRAVEEATGNKRGGGATMTAEELVAALKRTLVSNSANPTNAGTVVPAGPSGSALSGIGRPAQQLVAPGDLEGRLASGWKYVATVGERVVVELSHN